MTPYADRTFKALFKRVLDDSVENCSTAVSIGAWTPTGIGEDVEDFELTDDHVFEWLMLEMKDLIDDYMEENSGVHSNETQSE